MTTLELEFQGSNPCNVPFILPSSWTSFCLNLNLLDMLDAAAVITKPQTQSVISCRRLVKKAENIRIIQDRSLVPVARRRWACVRALSLSLSGTWCEGRGGAPALAQVYTPTHPTVCYRSVHRSLARSVGHEGQGEGRSLPMLPGPPSSLSSEYFPANRTFFFSASYP